MITALIIFFATYILMLSLPNHRAYVALCSAAVFIVLGVISPVDAFFAVDWNIILIAYGHNGRSRAVYPVQNAHEDI